MQAEIKFHWPKSSQIYNQKKPSFFWAVKYNIRCWLYRHESQELFIQIKSSELWSKAFRRKPYLFTPILNEMVDRRLSPQKRFKYAMHDIQYAQSVFKQNQLPRLLNNEVIFLGAINEKLSIYLSLNEVIPFEGLWALSIRDEQERRICVLTFQFRPHHSLIVGSIQGLKPSPDYDSKAIFAMLTKELYGLRPLNLLIEILRLCCIYWGCNQIVGLNRDNHPRGGRFNRKCRFHFDYNGFWSEYSDILDAENNYVIKVAPSRKNRTDIPSNKRAQYMRRYALLDAIQFELSRSM